MPITITLDLEDSTGMYEPNGRWIAATERLLEAFDAASVTATVFTIAEAARAAPNLIARVAAAGHELALHGLRHVVLGEVGPGRLREELREGAALLENASGTAVRGFRAPVFSLTPATAWAVDEIAEAGLAYSSSILPAPNPLHGWPGLPDSPFRWSNGLIELPCTMIAFAGRRFPLGGIYLRYMPMRALRSHFEASAPLVQWTYLHPYDADVGAPVHRFPHANWPTSLVLHTRRRATIPRLGAVVDLAGGSGPTLGAIASRLAEDGSIPTVEAGAE